jgi:hypothetical protein
MQYQVVEFSAFLPYPWLSDLAVMEHPYRIVELLEVSHPLRITALP